MLCVKMGSVNGFILDCSMYLFWFHIINKSRNALLASQSEEVTLSSQFLVVDTPPPPPPTDLYEHSIVAADWSVSTDYCGV